MFERIFNKTSLPPADRIRAAGDVDGNGRIKWDPAIERDPATEPPPEAGEPPPVVIGVDLTRKKAPARGERLVPFDLGCALCWVQSGFKTHFVAGMPCNSVCNYCVPPSKGRRKKPKSTSTSTGPRKVTRSKR